MHQLQNIYPTFRRAAVKRTKNNSVPDDEGITILQSFGNLLAASKRHSLPENMNFHLSILQGAVSESLT